MEWKGFSRPGAGSSADIAPTCRSRSPANARCAARAATPTATTTSAATLTLRELADLKGEALVAGVLEARRAAQARSTCRSSAASRSCATASSTSCCRSSPREGMHVQVVTSAVRPIPEAWAQHPAAADRGVDRRAARRARRAPRARHLRPHPEAHRRAPDHGALHGHAAACAARRLPARSSCSSGRPTRTRGRSGSASTRRRSARSRRSGCGPRIARGWCGPARPARALSEAADAEGLDRGVRRSRRRRPTSASSRRTTHCVSSDLQRRITPCQFGGNPDCAQCGCIASAGPGRRRQAPPARGDSRGRDLRRLVRHRQGGRGPGRPRRLDDVDGDGRGAGGAVGP